MAGHRLLSVTATVLLAGGLAAGSAYAYVCDDDPDPSTEENENACGECTPDIVRSPGDPRGQGHGCASIGEEGCIAGNVIDDSMPPHVVHGCLSFGPGTNVCGELSDPDLSTIPPMPCDDLACARAASAGCSRTNAIPNP